MSSWDDAIDDAYDKAFDPAYAEEIRLRECIAELEATNRERCTELIAENNELRGLVEEAYLEGYNDGRCGDYDSYYGWQNSMARQTLENSDE